MKIAFVGKGGAGKTTLTALFAQHLAAQGRTVLALDADINQNLAAALGATADPPALGEQLPLIKEYLRGSNPRISSVDAMVKTTPPGAGSRLLRVVEDNPIWDTCVRETGGVRHAATGGFAEADLGVSTRFDRTFIVCEPTTRGVGVYRQYLDYAAAHEVTISVIGNKVTDQADEEFLRAHAGGDLLACLGASRHVRAAEQGHLAPIGHLEPANRAVLETMRRAADGTSRDWVRLTRQAREFHLRNATAWANASTGEDLAGQIDPGFTQGDSHRLQQALAGKGVKALN